MLLLVWWLDRFKQAVSSQTAAAGTDRSAETRHAAQRSSECGPTHRIWNVSLICLQCVWRTFTPELAAVHLWSEHSGLSEVFVAPHLVAELFDGVLQGQDVGEQRTLQGLPQVPHDFTVGPLLLLGQFSLQTLQSSQYLLALPWGHWGQTQDGVIT